MSIRNPNNERSVKQRTESVSGMARKSSSSAKPCLLYTSDAADD